MGDTVKGVLMLDPGGGQGGAGGAGGAGGGQLPEGLLVLPHQHIQCLQLLYVPRLKLIEQIILNNNIK